ncbi:hypothetical protein ACJMK2_022193 [Sinanodonta woodiana]|uniref:Uncharacterized protein n=1 Tax=Sinanodonta woodiana TaxID=1069815 RepID=A0ABD3TJG2_SINWO
MCHCENKQEKDTPNVEKHPNESDTEHTSYVGEISFVNNQKSANIRLYSNTAIPNNVLTMLNNKWKLKIPDLLIYVHGCMKGLANTYRTSLTKVVKSTGAWIITDGKHEYVNIDNISEQPIIIGISELGDIINHQKDNPQVIGADTVLNSNHSHFILIDDGSRNTLSTTMIFRKELEREITKNGSWKEVPSVRIVFQGDDDRKKGYDGQETDISVVTVKVTHTCELNEDSSDSDLGLAILQALLKDARNKTNIKNRKYLLKLFEIAKNIQIYTILQQVKVLESCMMAALLEDKVEYVKLMLDNDFDLKAFLKQDILQELYNALRPNTMPKVYKLLEYLLSDSNIKLTKKESTQSSNGENANKHQVDEDSCMDLFVWSVLNNRQDMAKLFWRLGKDAMASALFAHALLSALSDKIDDADFKEICEKNSREFTKLATEVLKDGYTKGGVNLAKKLLIQKQKRWGDTSCVLIATSDQPNSNRDNDQEVEYNTDSSEQG